MSSRLTLAGALFFFAAACGGSTPPAADPSAVSPTPEATASPKPAPPPDEATPKPDAESAKPQKEELVEPTFTPDMSVDEAIKAIPQSAERRAAAQETTSRR